jgi:hypothetical protein
VPGQGIQYLPLTRIPEKWDPVWFAQFCREVLALADTRNAVEGPGITITGQPGELATVSASDDLQNLLLQTFVLTAPSGFLSFERILAGEPGVVDITDGGANANVTVSIADRGINLGKLIELSGAGVLGNPVDATGAVQNINPSAALSVLTFDGTTINFDPVDHTYVSDFNEAAQDAVGGILTDSTSIDFTYNDGANTITAAIVLSAGYAWTGAHSFALPITLAPYTVATLPAGSVGMRAYVTDALTPLYNATAVGGGAVRVPVFHNGTTWVTA